MRPTAQAQSHGAVQEQEQTEVRPTAEAQSHELDRKRPRDTDDPSAQPHARKRPASDALQHATTQLAVKREAPSTSDSSGGQAQSHEMTVSRNHPRTESQPFWLSKL